MNKFLVTFMMLASTSIPAFAETISTDNSDFAEIGSVIHDAAFDIQP